MGYFFCWMGTRKIERRARRFNGASLFHLALATAVFGVSLAATKSSSLDDSSLSARWLAGGVGILAFAEMMTTGHDFITALVGIEAPSLMRSPFLSASVGEFWTRRWNVAASELGFGPLCFAPLSRYGIVPGLFAAFFASAVAHALLAYMALGRWGISLICGAFFMVQPLLILVERAMKVRRWPATVARVWTVVALGVASPLFVEPAIQLLTPTLKAFGNVLLPTIVALGWAVVINAFFAVGQLAFCGGMTAVPKGEPAGGRRELVESPGKRFS